MTATSEAREDGTRSSLSARKRRALEGLSMRSGVFAIMAADHIGALSATVNPSIPDSVTDRALVDIKARLVETFADLASGVLVDPILGLDAVVQRESLPRDTGLMLGLEDGDYASIDNDPRLFDGWDVERASRSGATAVKCSFLYDPFEETAAAQAFVSSLVADCQEHDLPLFAEPLTPSSSLADRRSIVVESARQIGSLGVDVLKLEFPLDGSTDAHEWRDACLEVTAASPRPWTILSAGEDFDTYSRKLEVACASGASGFVAGRAIWGSLVVDGLPFPQDDVAEARRRFQHLADIAESGGTPWTAWFDAEATLVDDSTGGS